jgi:nucleotide-binding universal stress UspA family protein
VPSVILVPLDGSSLAERAIPLASTLARRNCAELVFARAVLTAGSLAPHAISFNRSLLLEARRYLSGIVERAHADGLRARSLICEGEASESIVQAVDSCAAELIVMSARGTGEAVGSAGSVAQGVLSGARVPVVVVPGLSQADGPGVRATRELPAVQDQTLLVTLSPQEAALTRQALRRLVDSGSTGWTAHHVTKLLARLDQVEEARHAVEQDSELRQAV